MARLATQRRRRRAELWGGRWLVNSRHRDFLKIRVHPTEKFQYDPRFFRSASPREDFFAQHRPASQCLAKPEDRQRQHGGQRQQRLARIPLGKIQRQREAQQ